MVKEGPELVKDRAFRPQFLAYASDIFYILPAARIGPECRCGQYERAAHPLGPHLASRILQKRMPVTVPEVHGNGGTGIREQPPDTSHQSTVLIVDRTAA